ncbi:hypothetical protein STEG23_012141, partial [Scotinomys teguina]
TIDLVNSQHQLCCWYIFQFPIVTMCSMDIMLATARLQNRKVSACTNFVFKRLEGLCGQRLVVKDDGRSSGTDHSCQQMVSDNSVWSCWRKYHMGSGLWELVARPFQFCVVCVGVKIDVQASCSCDKACHLLSCVSVLMNSYLSGTIRPNELSLLDIEFSPTSILDICKSYFKKVLHRFHYCRFEFYFEIT